MSVHPGSSHPADAATASPLPQRKGLHDKDVCIICQHRHTMSGRQIADHTGFSREHVRKHLGRYNVSANRMARIAAKPKLPGKNGRERYWAAREAGMGSWDAAYAAGIATTYAGYLEDQKRGISGRTAHTFDAISPDRDDILVNQLVALGGYPRFSEKMTRTGPVVCLPLIPFSPEPSA